MTNMVVAELARIPMSASLAATLSRATDYARAQAHLEVTLEHLLLALTEDPEAGLVLAASRIDVARLTTDISGHLGRIEERAPPDRPSQLAVSADLRRILEAAAAAAQQGRRREINGAIVLAAVVGDGRSTAAHLLSAHGMTFEGAIQALQRANAQAASQPPVREAAAPSPPPSQPAPPPPQAAAPAPRDAPPANAVQPPETPTGGRAAGTPPPSMDDLLAVARERVRKRHAPAEPDRGAEAAAAEAAAASSAPAEATAGAAAPYAPEWREAGEPAASPAYPPPPASHPSPAPADQLQAPPPSPHPQTAGPTAPGPRPQPQGGPPPPPPAPPSRPAVHPHWPMQTERASRPNGPPGPPPYGTPQSPGEPPPPPGSWTPPMPPGAPPMPAGAPSGGRPVRQPPPLPTSPGPPPVAGSGTPRPFGIDAPRAPPRPDAAMRGRAPPAGIDIAQDQRQPGPTPQGRTRPGPAVEIGQLVENIPKSMRVGIPERVEVRIGKASVKALAEGLQGGGAAWRHEVMVTKAMSVRLRAPEGGFFIESASPETQWIESALGLMSDDHASWRWTVTPRERGWKRLQLVVSARTVGADGLAAETALPDQVIDVKVRTNYAKTAAMAGGWVAAAIAGGLLAKFGEGLFSAIWRAAVRAVVG